MFHHFFCFVLLFLEGPPYPVNITQEEGRVPCLSMAESDQRSQKTFQTTVPALPGSPSIFVGLVTSRLGNI